MTIGGRTWTGAGMGLAAATLAYPAMLSFESRNGVTLSLVLRELGQFFILLVIFAGPGAVVLSCLHAALMERWAPRARSTRHIRLVGVLAGILLGVANLFLAFEAVSMIWGVGLHEALFSPRMAPWLIPAAAGGAGLGWGATIGLKPGQPLER